MIGGIYRDFMGDRFIVETETESSDSTTQFVVYQKVGDSSYTWIDKKEDFLAEVEDGVENATGQQYKFELIEEKEGSL